MNYLRNFLHKPLTFGVIEFPSVLLWAFQEYNHRSLAVNHIWGQTSWIPEILNDLNDRDLNDRKTPLNIHLFFWWNSFLVLAIASVALSWVSISNGLLWYCTILTPTELCLFFSSMHWIIKSGFADFDVGALSKFSTYYIPLPQQLASFAWYFHVVEGISQSQTLEYRFGRYLPVFFAHVHKILQSCLTAN